MHFCSELLDLATISYLQWSHGASYISNSFHHLYVLRIEINLYFKLCLNSMICSQAWNWSVKLIEVL